VAVSVSVVPGWVVVSVVVVLVLESAPDRDPLNELGMELGSELGRPPPPPQPPSRRPATRAGAATTHHHELGDFSRIDAIDATRVAAGIARTG